MEWIRFGNKWASIAQVLGRTEYWVKKHWKKLLKGENINASSCNLAETKDCIQVLIDKFKRIQQQQSLDIADSFTKVQGEDLCFLGNKQKIWTEIEESDCQITEQASSEQQSTNIIEPNFSSDEDSCKKKIQIVDFEEFISEEYYGHCFNKHPQQNDFFEI